MIKKITAVLPKNAVPEVSGNVAVRIASPLASSSAPTVRQLSNGVVIYGTLAAGQSATQSVTGTNIKLLSASRPVTVTMLGAGDPVILLEGEGRTGLTNFTSLQIANPHAVDIYYAIFIGHENQIVSSTVHTRDSSTIMTIELRTMAAGVNSQVIIPQFYTDGVSFYRRRSFIVDNAAALSTQELALRSAQTSVLESGSLATIGSFQIPLGERSQEFFTDDRAAVLHGEAAGYPLLVFNLVLFWYRLI